MINVIKPKYVCEAVKKVGWRYRETGTGKYVSKTKAHAYLCKRDAIGCAVALATYAALVVWGLSGIVW